MYARAGAGSHSDIVLEHWDLLARRILRDSPVVLVDGKNLSLADVVSVSRYGSQFEVDAEAQSKLSDGPSTLGRRIADGDVIYGVNTGLGGSADTRTKMLEHLQRTVTRELQYGILPPRNLASNVVDDTSLSRAYDASLEDSAESKQMPLTWSRAIILIRSNSLIKGCSAVRPAIVERLCDLVKHDIIPVIPLRGSISASGDLSPLAYLGGAVQGKRNIRIFSMDGTYSTAERALADADLQPLSLQAKEGLAIVNGTAASCAAGVLALHDAHGLAVLSQLLTAMAVEALLGTDESFHPFFAQVRQHPGQIESAHNIYGFLKGSKLIKVNDGTEDSLRQDRYSIRTASQWIGPVLEDFVLAHQQMQIECNSATDNPLMTPEGNFIHGGNFQAKAVSSAMEKVRQGLQSIGRMLYTQCTELINPATNRGLPPNLVAEDPSSSYVFKGVDIGIAALLSELGYLANPVNHVQNAEMGNQALNSLALISARYTHTTIDVLSQLAASHILATCQALDLRALHLSFVESYRSEFFQILQERLIDGIGKLVDHDDKLKAACWKQLIHALDNTTGLDAKARFMVVAKSLRNIIIDHSDLVSTAILTSGFKLFEDDLEESLRRRWCAHRDAYLYTSGAGDASPFISPSTAALYQFIRKDLGVPFLHSGKLGTPREGQLMTAEEIEEPPTMGYYSGVIYRAIRDGRLNGLAVKALDNVRKPGSMDLHD